MADKGDLALTAAKVALKGVAGSGAEEDAEPRASWKKKLVAGGLGGLAAFYLVNYFIGIVPLLDKLHFLFAGGIIYWSLSVWGIRPIQMLKERRAQKKLAESSEAPDADLNES